jgi:hypothetical protein
MKKKLSKIFKWIFLTLVMLFFATEIVLRLTSETTLRRWSDFKYQPDTLLGYRYLPNSKGTFCNIAYTNDYHFNSLGFPGDEFSPVKKQGIYRIIVVGASDDVGFNTNGPNNYVNLINSYFRTNNIGAEVINCSIDGSGKELQKLKFILGECIDYQPKLVLFAGIFPFEERFRYRTTYKNIRIEYEYQDINIDSVKKLIDEEIDNKCFKIQLYDYSYLFRYICKYYFDNKKSDDYWMPEILNNYLKKNEKVLMGYARSKIFWSVPKPHEKKKPKRETVKYSLEESLKLLSDLKTELSKREVKFVFLRKQQLSEDLKHSFYNNDVPLISLDIIYKDNYNFAELDGHSSQEGHKAIAQKLYKVLIDDIIPQKYIHSN